MFCAWCGRRLNGAQYIIRGVLSFCSERCWRAWNQHADDLDLSRFDDESPQP